MVALPQMINVDDYPETKGMVHIPDGDYKMMVVSSELKETSSRMGQLIEMTFVVVEGQYQGTELIERFNIVNANEQAVLIAFKQLASLGRAVGVQHISDTNMLHNKHLICTTKTEKSNDWTNDKGELIEGKEKSAIAKYKPLGQQNTAPAPSSPPATSYQPSPVQVQSPQQLEQPQQAPSTPPWAV